MVGFLSPSTGRRGRRPATAAVASLALWVALGCGDDGAGPDDEPPGTAEGFVATLNAGNVVGGATGSPGTGTATFTWDGTRLTFVLGVQNMTGIIAAHIHGPAQTDQNAPILLNLFIPATATGAVNGELARGAAVAGSPVIESGTLPSLVSLMREGRAYVLVHTQVNPDGEIRGQVARQN